MNENDLFKKLRRAIKKEFGKTKHFRPRAERVHFGRNMIFVGPGYYAGQGIRCNRIRVHSGYKITERSEKQVMVDFHATMLRVNIATIPQDDPELVQKVIDNIKAGIETDENDMYDREKRVSEIRLRALFRANPAEKAKYPDLYERVFSLDLEGET